MAQLYVRSHGIHDVATHRGRADCGEACAHAAAAAKSGRGRAYVQQVAQEPRRVVSSAIRFFKESRAYFNLTNESKHPIAYKGCIYPTAQHAFQALKFLPKYPDLAEHIRRCSSTDQARRETKRYRNHIRADWFSTHRGKLVHIAKMEEILSLKFQQHPDLCEELASTSGSELIYDNPSDAFWGVGPDNKGRNEFGRALMRLRKHVLEQAQATQRKRRG
ncbi:unnamed protein product [Peniophora sp. CBMAI 1063]|nr:unnamed protein product [Peniophora sp. CBMAI 1063]